MKKYSLEPLAKCNATRRRGTHKKTYGPIGSFDIVIFLKSSIGIYHEKVFTEANNHLQPRLFFVERL